MPDIYLPNIIKLELTNFSLYCEQSVVMDFSKPVSCLMGANGIGKSTLLNCVNFAITGRINPTNKKLKSIDTLDRGNNYYLQYFDGRISEVDKDYASTRIVFMLGNKRIEVVRNFFPDNSILEYKLDNETQDPRNYEDDVVRLANLNNYAQFVFLQLKVLTFDESRDCLFWNPSILTPTIFLCLGESVDNAERADELAREIQKVNSRIRNVQWEISKQSARLTTLIEEKSKTEEARPHYASEDEASAQNEYEEIIKELEEGESYHQGYTKERQQIYARITELTVEKVRLRKEYEEHYAELYAGNGHLYRNPIIMALTSDGCPICHTAHQKLPEHIEQALNQNVCPLCGEHIPETASEQTEIIAKLAKIDNATHPVDIKVTWPAINNVALIEVKWLGDSGQTQYRDARANEGAKQLIDYLASSVQEEPDKHFVGYLTVFDGRRGKTSNQYERQEINYRSEYSSHPSMNYRRFYMAECV